MIIFLKNNSGVLKKCKIGFSWTYLFFGFFVPLYRGSLKWAILSFIFEFISFGFFRAVFSFIYNGIYIRSLLEDGYCPNDDFSANALRQKSWII